ncbi:MAG TPA: trehalase family glycosidase [Chloroflexia bacterium]|nr:trehalase family glycosidase [Chloroflexia bacterium]
MGPGSYGIKRAINEMRAIFACQWQNGMLPQIRFMPGQSGYRPDAADWGVTAAISGTTALRTSGITQPPIVGLCLYEVFEKIGEEAQERYRDDFVAMAEGVEKYHNWLFRERDPRQEHIVACLHPWETGTDNSPAFDPLIDATRSYIDGIGLPVDTFGRADTQHVRGEHRPTDRDYAAYFGLMALFKRHHYNQETIIAETPFLLQDVLFNTLLVASLQSLARLQSMLAEMEDEGNTRAGELLELSEQNIDKAEALASAMRRKMWDEQSGFFYSYDVKERRLLKTPTVSSLMPLMAGVANRQQAARLIAHASNPDEFWTEVPLPSTAINSSSFNPLRYWSGPSWPVTNWLVYRGLVEHSSPLAEELCLGTLKMIAEGVEADVARRAAMQVMEHHSYGEEFTTPSNKQYAHAWLWDSAIVAVSWPLVEEKPTLIHVENKPGFWEYYHPHTGEPLGAAPMAWTASLYLEMQHALREK